MMTHSRDVLGRFRFFFIIALAIAQVTQADEKKSLPLVDGSSLEISISGVDAFVSWIQPNKPTELISQSSATNFAIFPEYSRNPMTPSYEQKTPSSWVLIQNDHGMILFSPVGEKLYIRHPAIPKAQQSLERWWGRFVKQKDGSQIAILTVVVNGVTKSWGFRIHNRVQSVFLVPDSIFPATFQEELTVDDEAIRVGSKKLPFSANAGIEAVIKDKSVSQLRPQLLLAAPSTPQQAAAAAEEKERAEEAASPHARLGKLSKIRENKIRIQTAIEKVIFGQHRMAQGFANAYEHKKTKPGTKPWVGIIDGPSGVGKTAGAKVFAREVFLDESFVLEINGNEFQSELKNGGADAHRLIGAAAAYQGKQKGLLTEFLKRTNGKGVVIINEADKMHPDVWELLMEFLDTGKVRTGDGELVESSEIYIAITSNRACDKTFPSAVDQWDAKEIEARAQTLTADRIKSYYKAQLTADDKFKIHPAVLNRVDDYFVAVPLSKEVALQIAELAVQNSNRFFMENFDVAFEMSPDVLKYLALTGFKSTDDGRKINRIMDTYFVRAIQTAGAYFPKDLPKGTRFQIKTKNSAKKGKEVVVCHGANCFPFPGPETRVENPLLDVDLIQKLQKMPEILNKRLIGQDDAIRSILQLLYSFYGDVSRTRPLSFFMVGSTGTGKTEMARAIAEGFFGSPERAAVLSMGEIKDLAGFNKYFGSDPGFVGSTIMREFELALHNNPEGGVIVFDEISNMGKTKEEKEQLFQKMYGILEEGKWTSPVTNTTYNLKKYIFVHTGNDGQQLFAGMTNDDMRLATWNANKERSRVRSLLKEAGVPEAYLGRLADSILMKPLTNKEMIGVALKLLKAKTKPYEDKTPGLKITWSSRFVEQLAKTFFTQDKGARSVRDITDERLPGIIFSALIEAGIAGKPMKNIKLHLDLEDTQSPKPYTRSQAPERKVNLHVSVSKGTALLKNMTWNLTDFAQARPITSAREAAIVAFHEIGHALVNDPMLTGQKLAFITIIPSTQMGINSLGYARYEDFPRGKTNLDIEGVVASVGRMMAGSLAQEMAGFTRDSGWSNDLMKIRNLISTALVEWGLIDELLAVRLDKENKPILTAQQSEILAKKTEEVILLARYRTQKFLRSNWGLVRSLTAELLKTGNMPGDRFDQIRADYAAKQSLQSSTSVGVKSCSSVVRGSQLAKPTFGL